MVKDKPGFGSNLLNLVLKDGIMAVSAHSIWELKSAPTVYNEVLDVITTLPSILLKSESDFFDEEYVNFSNVTNTTISPLTIHLLRYQHLKGGLDILELINQKVTDSKNEQFRKERTETFQMLASKPSNIYSREELTSPSIIDSSVSLAAFQLAASYRPKEIQKYIEEKKEAFPIQNFKSLLSICYILHYKYLQSERKSTESDVQDILMSAAYPYVDIVITEANQCEYIKQIKKRHNFLTNLEAISMRQVKTESYINSK